MISGDGDIGERVLREIEKAGGHRPPGCPWAALGDEYVQAVINGYGWKKDGDLARRWGADPPHALMLGIEYFGRAMVAIDNHDQQKRIDDDKAKQAAQAAQPQAPRGRRPPPSRR